MRTADFAPSHLFAALGRFAALFRAAGASRRVVHSLASLDDHLLRDMGLTRFDVDSALVEPVLADGTLLLAERAGATRRGQRAMAREARDWASRRPGTARAA